jgi:hypothetical protein
MDGAMTKPPFGGKGTGPNPTEQGKSGTKEPAHGSEWDSGGCEC